MSLRKSETPGPTTGFSLSPVPFASVWMGMGASETWRWSLSFLMALRQESIEDKDSKELKRGTDLWKERKWETGIVKSTTSQITKG